MLKSLLKTWQNFVYICFVFMDICETMELHVNRTTEFYGISSLRDAVADILQTNLNLTGDYDLTLNNLNIYLN